DDRAHTPALDVDDEIRLADDADAGPLVDIDDLFPREVAVAQGSPSCEQVLPRVYSVGRGEMREELQRRVERPVWPKPPSPRSVSSSSSTKKRSARTTGRKTIWAMRSPGRISKGSDPALRRGHFTSPV